MKVRCQSVATAPRSKLTKPSLISVFKTHQHCIMKAVYCSTGSTGPPVWWQVVYPCPKHGTLWVGWYNQVRILGLQGVKRRINKHWQQLLATPTICSVPSAWIKASYQVRPFRKEIYFAARCRQGINVLHRNWPDRVAIGGCGVENEIRSQELVDRNSKKARLICSTLKARGTLLQ